MPDRGLGAGPRIGPRAAQGERGFELYSDGILYGLQRFRCISLRSAAVHCGPGTVYQPKAAPVLGPRLVDVPQTSE